MKSFIKKALVILAQIFAILAFIVILKFTNTSHYFDTLYASFLILIAVALVGYSLYSMRNIKRKNKKSSKKETIANFVILLLGTGLLWALFACGNSTYPQIYVDLCGRFGCQCVAINIYTLLISVLIVPALLVLPFLIKAKITKL
jgi:cytochrome bd-type quinol oxidase subunit 2